MARVTDGMVVMELSLGLPVSEAKLEILSHAGVQILVVHVLRPAL